MSPDCLRTTAVAESCCTFFYIFGQIEKLEQPHEHSTRTLRHTARGIRFVKAVVILIVAHWSSLKNLLRSLGFILRLNKERSRTIIYQKAHEGDLALTRNHAKVENVTKKARSEIPYR